MSKPHDKILAIGHNLIGMRDGADHADVDWAFHGVKAPEAQKAYHYAIQIARGGGITKEVIGLVRDAEQKLAEGK